jgi:hypothetical protein
MVVACVAWLFAAAFVVLYYDAKARSGRINDDQVRSK